MANKVTNYLKYANLQMAGEAIFGIPKGALPGNTYESGTNKIPVAFLTDGNGRSSKFSPTQADEFKDDWKVLEHISNTTTGFSGTLFECLRDVLERGLKQGQLVMSIRSTEFIDDAIWGSGNLQLTLLNYFQHFNATTGQALTDAQGSR